MNSLINSQIPFSKDICRACLNNKWKNENITLFSQYDGDCQIKDLFFVCTGIEIRENDGMPDGICQECLKQTISAYNFKKLCRKSEYCLNQLFSLKSKEYDDKLNDANMYLVDEPISTSVIYSCRFCPKYFAEQTDLNLHENEHKLDSATPVETVTEENQSYTFNCDHCNLPFENERDRRDHKREVHRHEQKLYKCECGKILRSRNGFFLHKKLHRGEKKHICRICQQAFYTSTNLNVHLRIHLTRKPFGCHFTGCSKSFQTKAALETHFRVHTGEKPFICETCPSQFASLSNLIGHRKTHVGVKEFRCTICNQQFVTNQSLKKHFRRHTGEKPFTCETCNEKFISSTAVARHIQVKHSEKQFECSVCKKKFHLKYVWQRHLKGHDK